MTANDSYPTLRALRVARKAAWSAQWFGVLWLVIAAAVSVNLPWEQLPSGVPVKLVGWACTSWLMSGAYFAAMGLLRRFDWRGAVIGLAVNGLIALALVTFITAAAWAYRTVEPGWEGALATYASLAVIMLAVVGSYEWGLWECFVLLKAHRWRRQGFEPVMPAQPIDSERPK